MNTILVIILVFFSFTTQLFAATFYVDSSVGSDSYTSTQAQSQSTPWAHMPGMSGCESNCASYSVQTGDIFVLKGGSTWKPSDSSSTFIEIPASGITIKGGQHLETPWGTGYPILDGTGTNVSGRFGIRSNNKFNIKIDGIKIYKIGRLSDGSGYGVAIYNSSNVEVKNCWFEAYTADSVSIGYSNSHIYIHDNHFIASARFNAYAGDGYVIDDLQIYNNTFNGLSDYNPYGYHTDGVMIQSVNKSTWGITNLVIHHNKFGGLWTNYAPTAMIYLSGCSMDNNRLCKLSSEGPYSTSNTLIYDNIISFENNSWGGGGPIIYLINVHNGHHENLKIYNNTLSGDAVAAPRMTTCAQIETVNNLDFRNNIISGCDNGLSGLDQGASGTINVDHNLYNIGTRLIMGWVGTSSADCRSIAACQGAPFYSEMNGKSGNPRFVLIPNGTTGSGNWSLRSNSPAIDSGYNFSSLFMTDYSGIKRPQGSAWDIGASEYRSSTSLIPPQNFRKTN